MDINTLKKSLSVMEVVNIIEEHEAALEKYRNKENEVKALGEEIDKRDREIDALLEKYNEEGQRLAELLDKLECSREKSRKVFNEILVNVTNDKGLQ